MNAGRPERDYWRYQVVYIDYETKLPPHFPTERVYSLCECYFDADGRVTKWTARPDISPVGETVEELTSALDLMLAAVRRWKAVSHADLKEGMTIDENPDWPSVN